VTASLLAGTGTGTGLGNDSYVSIENLTGGSGADTLTGDAGANVLSGNSGDDTLNGGDGMTRSPAARVPIASMAATVRTRWTTVRYLAGSVPTWRREPATAAATRSSPSRTPSAAAVQTPSPENSAANFLQGGGGNDYLIGGAGADELSGGAGNDTFSFSDVSDSTGAGYDTLDGFDAVQDRIDTSSAGITGINTKVNAGTLSTASFDTDLRRAITAAKLGAAHAVLFNPKCGHTFGPDLPDRGPHGVAGYQAGQDLVLHLNAATNLGSLSTADFI